MKKVTSFMAIKTGEGMRLSYTYSEVDSESGNIISQNNKGNFIVMDSNLLAAVNAIFDFTEKREE